MNEKRSYIIYIIILILLSLEVIAPTQSACGTISSAGIYTLDRNVNSSTTCFTISANQVVLDCAGYNINYSVSSAEGNTDIGISLDNLISHTIIKNCNIYDGNFTDLMIFRVGINGFYKNNNITIENSNFTAITNDSEAVYLSYSSNINMSLNKIIIYASKTIFSEVGGTGIDILHSINVSAFFNEINITGATNGFGIIFSNVSNSTIGYNIININGGSNKGIRLLGSNQNNLTNNTITTIEFGNDGIILSSATPYLGSQGNSITANKITTLASQSPAIHLQEPTSAPQNAFNIIYGNILNTSSAGGTPSSNGIYIGSSFNNVTKNIINSTNYGIEIKNANNNISSNSVTSYGIKLGGANDTIADNNFISIISYSLGGALELTSAQNNTINKNKIYVNSTTTGIGIFIRNGSINNNFTDNLVTVYGSADWGFGLFGGLNNTFHNDNLSSTGSAGLDIAIGDGNATLINVTYGRPRFNFTSQLNTPDTGSILLKRYILINLSNYSHASIKDSNITGYNISFSLVANTTTNANGLIPRVLLLNEFIQNKTATYTATPHRINVTIENYDDNFTTINLSSVLDPVNIIRTIYLSRSQTGSPTNLQLSSSAGTSFTRSASTTISCTYSDDNPSTISVTSSDGTAICSSNSNSCSGDYTPTTAETKTITCTATDASSNINTATLSIIVNQETSGTSSSTGSSGSTTGTNTGISPDSSQTSTPNQPETQSQPIESIGNLIDAIINLMNIEVPANNDVVSEVIIGEEAIEQIPQIEEQEITVPEESVQVEGTIVAIVNTEAGNNFVLRRGEGRDKDALGISFKTSRNENFNIKFLKDKENGIEKPRLDIGFGSFSKIKSQINKIDYPSPVSTPIVSAFFLLFAMILMFSIRKNRYYKSKEV